jgi:hypothetical protein
MPPVGFRAILLLRADLACTKPSKSLFLIITQNS